MHLKYEVLPELQYPSKINWEDSLKQRRDVVKFRIRHCANNKAHGLIETLNLGWYKILNIFVSSLVTLNYNNKCPDIRVYDQH